MNYFTADLKNYINQKLNNLESDFNKIASINWVLISG